MLLRATAAHIKFNLHSLKLRVNFKVNNSQTNLCGFAAFLFTCIAAKTCQFRLAIQASSRMDYDYQIKHDGIYTSWKRTVGGLMPFFLNCLNQKTK